MSEEELEKFKALIDKVCSSPTLAIPHPDLPYSGDIDESAYVLG